jgi:hypothetical protein
VAVALTVFAAALYFAFSYQDPRAPDSDSPEPGAVDPGVAAQKPAPAESSREPAGISIGSTLGEVYAVQGVPTLTQGDIWHYGQSRIHFVRGKVVSWTEHPDNPLRIARDQSAPLLGGTFDVGSTKNEVRAIQGTPVTETDTVWDYAPSRVFFEHNRVVRWEESPMQPLRVPR